ncbi:hypothetical protein WJX74_002438 [Apatococcus lobatus]|uniref:Peptidase M14 domain-containing protein n=1 Tax=Apatococcus lobatus TaxID=904363 RepID=A0AAW1RWA3_9CHLO
MKLKLKPGQLLAVVLICLAIGAFARPVDDTKKPEAAKPDFNVYHTQHALTEYVAGVVKAHPSTMQMQERSRTDKSGPPGAAAYTSSMQVVTVEPGGLTEDHSNKIRLLLVFGEHGRELITTETSFRLLRLLADSTRAFEDLEAQGAATHRIRSILHRSVFKILPMFNMGGRKKVEAGDLCERKNGRGVDTNRNWDIHWGFQEKDYDPSEEYPGTAPFSEPETQILKEIAEEFVPHVWLNVHSGMEALFMPYDHVPTIPQGPGAAASYSILEELNEVSCRGQCAVGSGGESVGYLAHGTATDYMYEKLKVPLSFTWEIYGDSKADFHDCFRMFNPLQRLEMEEVAENWALAVFRLLELLPKHPAIPHLQIAATSGSHPSHGSQRSKHSGANLNAAKQDESSQEPQRVANTNPEKAAEVRLEGQEVVLAGRKVDGKRWEVTADPFGSNDTISLDGRGLRALHPPGTLSLTRWTLLVIVAFLGLACYAGKGIRMASSGMRGGSATGRRARSPGILSP